MADSTVTKLPNWRNNRRRIGGQPEYVWDVIEPGALGGHSGGGFMGIGTLTDNLGGTADTTITTIDDPADTPADADALRDDLVTNAIADIRNNIKDVVAQHNLIISDLAEVPAKHAATDKWQGVMVRPLKDSQELHYLWIPQRNWDCKYPVYAAYVLVADNSSAAGTLTLTYDCVQLGMMGTATVCADGATALDTTLAAIVAADCTEDYPLTTVWGKINGLTDQYDGLFFKTVISGSSSSWHLDIAKFIIGYKTF